MPDLLLMHEVGAGSDGTTTRLELGQNLELAAPQLHEAIELAH